MTNQTHTVTIGTESRQIEFRDTFGDGSRLDSVGVVGAFRKPRGVEKELSRQLEANV